MAEKIVFNYEEMNSAVATLKKCSEQFKTDGATLVKSIENATASWEGASKEKFNTLMQSVNEYVTQSVPAMVQGLSDLLKNNADRMSETDTEIAKNIPDSI